MSNDSIIFEGRLLCIALNDGTRLYCPQTLPDRGFTRKYDQIITCGANERSTEDIGSIEYFTGVLETKDRLRSPSMRRWTLVELFLTPIANIPNPT